MFQSQFIYNPDNYFEGLIIQMEEGFIKLSDCTFVSGGEKIPFDAVQAPVPADDEFDVNYRLFLHKGDGHKDFEYHFQCAYIDESGFGNAAYNGGKQLMEVLFDVVVSPDGSVNGFLCTPVKKEGDME
jgi:hypothetical protein